MTTISHPLRGSIYQLLRYETSEPDALTEKICALLPPLLVEKASTPATRMVAHLRAFARRREALKGLAGHEIKYLATIADEFERIHNTMIVRYDQMPWRPISELSMEDRYGDENGFLLLAPELVDLDCNAHGVGMGYWQDDGLMWHASQEECDSWPDDRPRGAWMACKWSMTNDEWCHVVCHPTHYLRLKGAEQ